MERNTFDAQMTNRLNGNGANNLFEPVRDDGGERGRSWEGRTKRSSLYTTAALHRKVTLSAAAIGIGALALVSLARPLRFIRR
jgi:hypothetical protein